jgi:hypothetical protein
MVMFVVLICLLCVCCVYVGGAWAFGQISSIFQTSNSQNKSFAWTWPMWVFGTVSAPPQNQIIPG